MRSEQENDQGEWEKRDARYASLSSATAFIGWTDYVRSARLQANHNFDLKDAADRRSMVIPPSTYRSARKPILAP
ncbi:hypothetical protein HSBAA_63230 [Vreelandella sulfidaeris]|uniref:Uncharacterized protein n=1 Tax=Vreelandella sulfidaeris TaxID=115553 RepID=A0A455UH31_9GAMM|nr:hypothetical protein HSBAA_63230 [Halomonas sulfidaeris]